MPSSILSTWPLFQIPTAATEPELPSKESPSSGDESKVKDQIDHDASTYSANLARWPEAPPWRRFLDPANVDQKEDKTTWIKLLQLQRSQKEAQRRGESFRVGSDEDGKVLLAVNAAIHLRRPLLVRGEPGTGKTSLAYALAHRLQLGPVLHWRITARTRLVDGLYRYDALGMLQDLQRDDFQLRRQNLIQPEAEEASAAPKERQLADYISLGPVGTAFLPSLLPRVLLIDEIDKADPQLPNELLHLFEEGEFDIPELTRERRHLSQNPGKHQAREPWSLATADLLPQDSGPSEGSGWERRVEPRPVAVKRVPVRCCAFPIVVMTSNDERDFSPAFKRRCIRISMPTPKSEQLKQILRCHFNRLGEEFWSTHQDKLDAVIADFMREGHQDRRDRATDQLLNFLHLFSEDPTFRPSAEALDQLQSILFTRLGSGVEP